MSRPQQVAWFPTRKEAESLEAKLYAKALASGQTCSRWAEIIVEPEGYGVPVKDRVLSAVTSAERAKVKEWTPPAPTKALV